MKLLDFLRGRQSGQDKLITEPPPMMGLFSFAKRELDHVQPVPGETRRNMTEPDPIVWKGYWPDDTAEDRAELEPWETYELVALGREAGDMRNVTLDDLRDLLRQNPHLADAFTVTPDALVIRKVEGQWPKWALAVLHNHDQAPYLTPEDLDRILDELSEGVR